MRVKQTVYSDLTPSNSGSRAMFTAIRRASSSVNLLSDAPVGWSLP
jgi:hypothetical protein